MSYYSSDEISDLKQENLKLKQKIEDIRTVIVDIFDKDTEYGDVDLCYDALIKIDRILRGGRVKNYVIKS